ncbi:ABC transporter related protein [Thermaerobacter marianensis DSM 12885]|uniref:ABC transporter related protein n=1 Tax=Thermaerobacter marianensis (strain ATCC 700841 / DSM 12885 / JCM 10246 / 7p75a) TaxID=644966 RepID=E6SHB3_THEM7|nr:metal ABC transporter ATP-binding protein [Thermaerobacter marianensis]ADU50677.1 ABC transporter related protein [Thermaerobacter marianensis DSM 12885]
MAAVREERARQSTVGGTAGPERPGAPAVVELADVAFAYGPEPVLEGVSLTVRRGEFLGLVGPNGSGKTTLLRILLGLEEPTRGRARLFGQDVRSFRQWWRVGYVPQRPAALAGGFPATVEEVVATGLVAAGGRPGHGPAPGTRTGRPAHRPGPSAGGRPAPRSPREALALVGLEHLARRPIGRLSGGQQQRVFLARALVSRPELLVLDEPLEGVDAATQDRFYRLVRELREREGLTVIMVSHDIGVVSAEVTTLACLNRRLFFHGAPEQLEPGAMAELYGFPVTTVHHRH